jgi:hypothetical protein
MDFDGGHIRGLGADIASVVDMIAAGGEANSPGIFFFWSKSSNNAKVGSFFYLLESCGKE